jgi:hypothetical protein
MSDSESISDTYSISKASSESDVADGSTSPKEWISLPDNDMDLDSMIGVTVSEKNAQSTAITNKNRFDKAYRQHREHFKRKFCDAFLYSVKDWLLELDDFIKNDSYWEAIVDTRAQRSDSDSDDEALLAAIDKRKYKIFKAINWEMVKDVMEEETEDESAMIVDGEKSEIESVGTDNADDGSVGTDDADDGEEAEEDDSDSEDTSNVN